MKLFEAERYIKDQLKEIYDEQESANIASLAIEHVTGLTKTERISNKHSELSPVQFEQIEKDLQRLRRHEPIQYIMNRAWFYGMELYVDKNVLIPRPETEELVQWIVDDVQASGKDVLIRKPMEADETTQLKILDVGTGSGCIPLALKKAMPKAEVWGCDISEEALNVARRNGSSLDIRVDFQGVNFLDEAQQKLLPTVNIIVSNPPYVPLKDKKQMNANVVDHEPHTALFVTDEDPLIFYKALAKFGKKRLYENGSIYMEIHEEIGNDVVNLFKENGYCSIDLKKDMQGKNRMVKASPLPSPIGRGRHGLPHSKDLFD
jgi:release factor glutamine methyltransferase